LRGSTIGAPNFESDEVPMISEVVTFKLRPGMTRAEVVAMYRKT